MGIRPFSLMIQRARLAAFACVAGVCFWHARTACSRPIEVVPTQDSTASPNVSQSERPKKDFPSMMPGPRRSWNFGDSDQGMAPSMMPHPPNPPLSARERELLERRRNWVFMTPEELMSGEGTDEMLGMKKDDKDGTELMTPMERYYEQLLAPNRTSTTNQLDKSDSDSWNKETNALTGEQQSDDSAHPFESPFNSKPSPEVFRPIRPTTFSDVFGTGGNDNPDDPETKRLRQEQQSHMENFKKLWDMDQSSAAVPASAPVTGNSASPSAFPSAQPVLGTATPSWGSTAPRSGNPAPAPVSSPHAAPPSPPPFTIPRHF